MRLLAVSGSLRAHSSNTELLCAAAALAPDGVDVALYTRLNELPHFNPDLEGDEPSAVRDWCAQLESADGVLISSPEYAHGVPGALKNALDWVVGSGELMNKPVALLNATPPAAYAQASLTETLTVMSAQVITEASISVPLRGKNLDAAGIVADPELSGTIAAAVATLARAVRETEVPTL